MFLRNLRSRERIRAIAKAFNPEVVVGMERGAQYVEVGLAEMRGLDIDSCGLESEFFFPKRLAASLTTNGQLAGLSEKWQERRESNP